MDILMPQLGETVAEGKITAWFKSIGEAVAPGDNLFEIETDKVCMEVPATAAGMIAEIRVAAGEVAPVGAVVAVLAAKGAATNVSTAAPREGAAQSRPASKAPTTAAVSRASAPALATSAPQTAMAASRAAETVRPIKLDPFHEVRTPPRNFGPAKIGSGVFTTPLARRLAGEAGVDLGRVAGSGPHGRIVGRDVEAAAAAATIAARTPMALAPSSAVSADRVKALYEAGSYEEVPLDAMRCSIAARLSEAVRTIPQFHLTVDVAIDRLNAIRDEANAVALPDRAGEPAFRLTVTDFIVKALALALQRVPSANAAWAEDCILRFRHSDIGVAIAIPGGLVTPVIRGAERKSLAVISAEVRDLAERARTRRLNPAELVGGASAISNLGMHGVREFAAIINPPHATILAAGAAARRPIETADGVRFAGQMTVTLTCDHRLVDGALGAELLGAFRHFIERPIGLML
jgi:pyruvate dehydrogenase E2 component (dihydrolipoamide acetyltransferase)